MVLEVRGNLEGLLDTDNSKRTPVHLAAICGQGEVVNFFLDRGGLWSRVFKFLSLRIAFIFIQMTVSFLMKMNHL